MKLFVYYDSGYNLCDIHAVRFLQDHNKTLCSVKGAKLTYISGYDKKDHLDTTRPFCKDCNKILKKKGIDMKQLAINQKLGVR